MKKRLTSYRFRIAVACIVVPLAVGAILFAESVRRYRVAERELREHGAFIMGDLYTVVVPSDVNDDQLAALLRRMHACRRPRRLILHGCQINSDGFDVIARMTWLYQLSLWSTNVTDEEIGQLEQLQQLENLNVGGTRVTDAGIAQLAKLKALTSLNALGSRASSEGVEQLKAQLPNLDVVVPEDEPKTEVESLL